MRKIIITVILVTFLSALITLGYNIIYKEGFLDNDVNLIQPAKKKENISDILLNTGSFENFKDFYSQIQTLSGEESTGFSEDDTGSAEINNAFNFYQDINFESIIKNPSLKAVMNTIDKKPHNLNGVYFGALYGIGSEDVRNFFLTDIIKLVVYNENTKNLTTVSIPRDLLVHYDGTDMKINYVYDHIFKQTNDKKKSIELFTNFLSEEFQVPINYYLMINFGNFTEFVDSIGGVEFCAQKPIYWYDEDTGRKELVMNTGCSTLTGEDALKVSRTRKQDNDFYRTLRQTQMLKSVYEKVVSMNYADLSRVLLGFIGKIDTNLNIGEMLYSAGNFDIKRNVNIVINADCNLLGGQIKNLKFCLLKNLGKKEGYELTPIVEKETINHYIHSIVLYPELFNCEFEGKGPVDYMLNLKNIGMKIKRYGFSRNFEITNLKGCTNDSVNYFLSQQMSGTISGN